MQLEKGRGGTNFVGACLFILPHAANLLRVHVVHGEERLTPVAGSVRQRVGLLAVEHGVCVHDLCASFLGSLGEEHIATAFIACQVVVLGNVRDRSHLAHEGAGDDVATAAVGKWKAGHHGNAADVDVVPGVDLAAQPVDQSRPHDVGIGLGEDIPIPAGTQLPRPHHHVEELELIQLPAALHVSCAVLLRDGTFLLRLVQLELFVLVPDFGVDPVENIVDMVFTNLLLLEWVLVLALWMLEKPPVPCSVVGREDG